MCEIILTLQFNPQICVFSALLSHGCVAPVAKEQFAEAMKVYTPYVPDTELVRKRPLDPPGESWLRVVDREHILDVKPIGGKKCILLSSAGYLQARQGNTHLVPMTTLPQLLTDNALAGDFALSTVQLARLLLSGQQVQAYELLLYADLQDSLDNRIRHDIAEYVAHERKFERAVSELRNLSDQADVSDDVARQIAAAAKRVIAAVCDRDGTESLGIPDWCGVLSSPDCEKQLLPGVLKNFLAKVVTKVEIDKGLREIIDLSNYIFITPSQHPEYLLSAAHDQEGRLYRLCAVDTLSHIESAQQSKHCLVDAELHRELLSVTDVLSKLVVDKSWVTVCRDLMKGAVQTSARAFAGEFSNAIEMLCGVERGRQSSEETVRFYQELVQHILDKPLPQGIPSINTVRQVREALTQKSTEELTRIVDNICDAVEIPTRLAEIYGNDGK